MTDETPPAMEHDKLTEAMALAIEKSLAWDIENDVYAGELTHEERCKVATAALKALRDTLVPVGHRYTNIADGSVTFTPNKWNMNGNYFVETPLYALPEVKP